MRETNAVHIHPVVCAFVVLTFYLDPTTLLYGIHVVCMEMF
jgi:hypothetical protein